MVADYIQAQLKMSEVQLLFAKKSLCQRNPSDRSTTLKTRRQVRDLRHGTGDTDLSETNLIQKPESVHKLQAQQGHLDFTEKCKPSKRPTLTAKRSSKFTLYPSEDSEVASAETAELLSFLKRASTAAALQAQERLPAPQTKESTLVLSKPFEYFPTPKGDHRLCYFQLKNNSPNPVAYKVTANEPKRYEIAPAVAWIPAGRTWNISVKYVGNQLSRDHLANDRIIITTYCKLKPSGRNPLQELIKLEEVTPSSTAVFPVKDFVIHPCSILPQRFNTLSSACTVEIPLSDSESLKHNYAQDVRRTKLQDRNEAERLFDYMQTEANASVNELKKIHRKCNRIGLIFNFISYLVFISLLGLALYFSIYRTKVKQESVGPTGWMIRVTQSICSFTEALLQTAVYSTWTGYKMFLVHPLAYTLKLLCGL